ncbi:MAG: PaaI family thioesterase [Actinomycetota bacterium]|nr:PaaI family thioesterase [Actinomycetota bacterium]
MEVDPEQASSVTEDAGGRDAPPSDAPSTPSSPPPPAHSAPVSRSPGDGAPGVGGAEVISPLQVSPQRVAAATALRRLGHALVAREVDDAILGEIADRVGALLGELDRAPARRRPIGAMKLAQFEGAAASGERLEHFPDCVVSGQANPLGIAIVCTRDGDEAVARVTLGAAFEGAPGRAHGGIVAAVFDDTMGYVLMMERTPAYTGRLSITYRAPAPVGEELEFRAKLRRRTGRKLDIVGQARHEETVVAEAEGLFIAVDPARFAAW